MNKSVMACLHNYQTGKKQNTFYCVWIDYTKNFKGVEEYRRYYGYGRVGRPCQSIGLMAIGGFIGCVQSATELIRKKIRQGYIDINSDSYIGGLQWDEISSLINPRNLVDFYFSDLTAPPSVPKSHVHATPSSATQSPQTDFSSDLLQAGENDSTAKKTLICELCGKKRKKGDRYCGDCTKTVLESMEKGGYLQPTQKGGYVRPILSQENIRETKYGNDR